MKLVILWVLFIASSSTDGGKILAIFPYQYQSHNVMLEPLMMGLARAGHTVDVVSHFPPENPVPGFKHISLQGTLSSYVNNVPIWRIENWNKGFDVIGHIAYVEPLRVCDLLGSPQVQNILNTTMKYDLMVTQIFGGNCHLAVAYRLKLPVIGVVTSTLYAWAHDPFFNSYNPSYIPSQYSSFAYRMSFVERMQNLITHFVSKFLFHYYDKTVSQPLANKYVNDLPSLNDIYHNITLVLVNAHRSINGVQPINPSVIEVAGLHIDETQKLSEELEVYLNSSKAGVVYFSMGSMLKSETFSSHKIQAIYDSFAERSDYKVLWKGKVEEMPKGLPANVKMVRWAPQTAVLRHPNVKAFVTHGGLMGTQEAIHAGVPMIGIPFFADQMSNVAGYALRGIAVQLNYEDITKASFSNALREVLTNRSYRSNMERVSRLFKDRPLSPMDEAVYWVEYVMRNGGDSLKSSALHLYWFQYYLIDVGLFLLAVTVLVLIIVFVVIRKVLGILGAISRSAFPQKLKTT